MDKVAAARAGGWELGLVAEVVVAGTKTGLRISFYLK
jgi:hypothetical protein